MSCIILSLSFSLSLYFFYFPSFSLQFTLFFSCSLSVSFFNDSSSESPVAHQNICTLKKISITYCTITCHRSFSLPHLSYRSFHTPSFPYLSQIFHLNWCMIGRSQEAPPPCCSICLLSPIYSSHLHIAATHQFCLCVPSVHLNHFSGASMNVLNSRMDLNTDGSPRRWIPAQILLLFHLSSVTHTFITFSYSS